uniref:Odorant receptor n=1 Tax=Anopheles atroparvus TaxID=41427 RepID=A0A182JD32_ANOAO
MAKIMGVWPQEYVAIRVQWYRKLYYFMMLMHWFNTYLQVEFFFRNLGNLNLIVQGLCSFCSICTTGIKAMRMHSYEAEILHIWRTMESATLFKKIHFLRTGDNKHIFTRIDDHIDRQWKEVHLNLRFYCLVVGAVASTYSIIPACMNLYNEFQGNDFNRSLVYNTYYPFIEEYRRFSPLHEVLFCSESLSGFTTWAGVVAFDGLYVVLVLYATSLMRMLGDLMQETTNQALSDVERTFFLRECLQQHIKTIQLSDSAS